MILFGGLAAVGAAFDRLMLVRHKNAVHTSLVAIWCRVEDQKIPDLAEKVGELKNWKQIGLVFITAAISSIFTGTIGGVIGWLIRGSRV